ncbi:DMT family transporter [uncultured Sphingomonas sp.]|uniref:DMT family transporter n=1 Tax=uncultured Sphingomonas sp. TaxID=158754 RepID=UPI0035CBD793
MDDNRAAPTMGATEWTLMLVLSVLWGGSFFFYKVLVAQVPPFTVVLGRVGLAAVMLNLLLIIRRDPVPRDLALWGRFIILGLLNNVVPFTLFAFGETRISSGLASILNATTPLFGVVVAHLFTADERLSWGKAAGVAFGLAGVAVLVGPDALRHAGSGDLLGEAACLGAALTYAFASLYGRRFRGLPPLKVATGQVTGSTLVLIPLSAAFDAPWTLPMPDATVWLAFAGIALFSTAFAYVLYFRILATAGATNLLFVTFLLPVSAIGLGVAFLGEAVSARTLAGMALIGLGLVAFDGRLAKRLRKGGY